MAIQALHDAVVTLQNVVGDARSVIARLVTDIGKLKEKADAGGDIQADLNALNTLAQELTSSTNAGNNAASQIEQSEHL